MLSNEIYKIKYIKSDFFFLFQTIEQRNRRIFSFTEGECFKFAIYILIKTINFVETT